MKQIPFLLLFIFITSFIVAQSGTIKIVKPPTKDKTIQADSIKKPIPKQKLLFGYASTNYTFKSNKNFGYEFGVAYMPGNTGPRFGIEYSEEYQYYQLSAYNQLLQTSDIAINKSQNRSDYIKVAVSLWKDRKSVV